MTTTAIESLVRIVYTKPENELTADEKAAREHLQDALNQFNQAVERFHQETPVSDSLLGIELYPTDESEV